MVRRTILIFIISFEVGDLHAHVKVVSIIHLNLLHLKREVYNQLQSVSLLEVTLKAEEKFAAWKTDPRATASSPLR